MPKRLQLCCLTPVQAFNSNKSMFLMAAAHQRGLQIQAHERIVCADAWRHACYHADAHILVTAVFGTAGWLRRHGNLLWQKTLRRRGRWRTLCMQSYSHARVHKGGGAELKDKVVGRPWGGGFFFTHNLGENDVILHQVRHNNNTSRRLWFVKQCRVTQCRSKFDLCGEHKSVCSLQIGGLVPPKVCWP